MISINQLCIEYGSFVLFKDVSFMINPRDRIGLVGKNGAGKTTLLRLICGIDKPHEGTISKSSDVTFGYLPQQMTYSDTKTVFDEALSAFAELMTLERKIKETEDKLHQLYEQHITDIHELSDELIQLKERYKILGGINCTEQVELILVGLGFQRQDFQRYTAEFSGGWRMRIELAKILLQRPHVLLLDEPTNHLDIESIQWLEDFLKNYNGAVVLVSHDKAFLDNVTNRTVEITLGKVNDYKVPYSQYVVLRNERRQQQLAAYTNQQKAIEETERFIERFRYKATKAVQVQSRIKQLDKIERLEVEPEDLATLSVRFPASPRTGAVVVETEKLTKKYGELTVFGDVNLVIERGQKVAFVGRNGEGKTTLVKILLNQLEHSGICKIGYNVEIGYFAQNQAEMLDKSLTVFQTIDNVAVGNIRTQIRGILGAFLFGGEAVDKKVSVLSGGECARLALAKLLLQPYSLLVLDEPTNHLDMRSKDVLKQALMQYDGTLIVVSHDRDFLDGLVEKVFEFKSKNVKEHLGGIYDFLERKNLINLREIERKDKELKNKPEETFSDNKIQYQEKKEIEKQQRKIKNLITKSEERISQLETQIAETENLMASPEAAKNPQIFVQYKQLKNDLDAEMENWEKLHEA